MSATSGLERVAEELRRDGKRADLVPLIEAARAQVVEFEADELAPVLGLRGTGAGAPPQFVARFIAEASRANAPRSVLDASAGLGGWLATLARELSPERALGIEASGEAHQAAQLLFGSWGAGIEWRQGDALSILEDEDEFDLVVCAPAWGGRAEIAHFALPLAPDAAPGDTPNELISLKDERGALLALQATLQLSERGTAWWLMSSRFVAGRPEGGVAANLARLGWTVNAALSLPQGTDLMGGAVLLRISRRPAKNLFVGQMSRDDEANRALWDNLQKRRHGDLPALGMLSSWADFRSFEALVAARELRQEVRALGLRMVPLRSLLRDASENSVKVPRWREESAASEAEAPPAFEDAANAIYLPMIGKSPVVTSPAELRLKAHNVAQIALDEKQALASYVAGLLNSPLGLRLRESWLSGVTIPKITKGALLEAELPLPPMSAQLGALEVQSRITDLATQLETLRRETWSKPGELGRVRRDVEQLNRDSGLTAWLDTLPYPLASVLWTYKAAKTSEKKVEHLFHFFEALSQWSAVVMLSAFASNETFCETHRVQLRETEDKGRNHFKRTDFGGWNNLGLRLSKALRRLLHDDKTRAAVGEIFGGADDAFLGALSQSELYSELEAVRIKRNDWKGHGGAWGETDFKQHRVLLEGHLAKVRGILAESHKTVPLLRPESMTMSGGVIQITAQRLMGTRVPFVQKLYSSREPLDSTRLYLLPRGGRAIELKPFVRMMQSPATQQNACYFYNKTEGEEVRWVSYHFPDEAELRGPDPEVRAAVSFFAPDA